ncbi:MAG: type II secretion system F family protein [Pirellulaceae bacterium]
MFGLLDSLNLEALNLEALRGGGMFSDFEVLGTFLGITLVLFVGGSLLMSAGQNRAMDYLESSSGRSLGIFTKMFAYMVPISDEGRNKIQADMVKAGYYGRYAAEDFLALRNAAIFAWLLFLAAAVYVTVDQGQVMTIRILMLGGIVLAMIWAIPRVILSGTAAGRVKRIHYALPDALDMITMTMSAGMPLQRAINHVGLELKGSHPDLACELAILDGQAAARSLDHGLREFAKRVDQPDVTALSTLIHHAEKLGGNVGTAFHEFADSIRESRRQRAEEKGNRTSVKLLFPVIFFLAPPIYVLLLGPAVMELRNFTLRETQEGGVLNQDELLEEATANPSVIGTPDR